MSASAAAPAELTPDDLVYARGLLISRAYLVLAAAVLGAVGALLALARRLETMPLRRAVEVVR